MTPTRRLAAILAADVAGYSRLMAADEAGTLARLKLMRADHFEPAIRAHGGRLVGEAGDSLLVEFASASAAVTCAAEVQAKLATLNVELPEDRRMCFRMGINLGEVIADGATVHGDGVNVAARLEKLSEPGGVLIARVVHDQVKGKVPLAFEDQGDKPLRNIAELVRVFRLALGSPNRSDTSTTSTSRDRGTTVAVLPFTNMSGDPEQEYFADGITEDLITALAKFRALSIAARNSTFVYKGKSVKVQDVGRELGVGYVIEGSVRKGGDRVRVTAQLIDTATGAHLWAERFDRDLSDVFAVQDEIVAAITAQLSYSITDAVVANRRDLSPGSVTAGDHVWRGWAAWRRGSEIEAHDHFMAAVKADPKYPNGLAALGFYYSEDRFAQTLELSDSECKARAFDLGARAANLNAGDPGVYNSLGSMYIDLGDLDQAKFNLEMSLRLNPFMPDAALALGCTIALMGRHREGLAIMEKVFWLEPRMAPAERVVMLVVHYLLRDYEAAVADFAMLESPPAYHYLLAAISLAQLGRTEEMKRAMATFESRKPKWFDNARTLECWCDITRLPEDKDNWREGFRKAGLIP